MYPMTEIRTRPTFAVVGSPYVSEHHSDEIHRHLPALETTALIDFEQLLAKLRSVLSLQSHQN